MLRFANSRSMILLAAGTLLAGTATAQDFTLSPQSELVNPKISAQNIQGLQVDVKSAAASRLQRDVEITVPYEFTNLPASINQVAIHCGVEIEVTGTNRNTRGWRTLKSDTMTVSGGGIAGSHTFRAKMPPDGYFENMSLEDIQSISQVELPSYTCGAYFNGPSFDRPLMASGLCANTDICAGATYSLSAQGQF